MTINRTNISIAKRMTSDELTVAGMAIFGDRWVRPLARVIGCDPRTLFFVKYGERVMSATMSAKVRAFADLGPAGLIIRDAVKNKVPEARPMDAHLAAREAVAILTKAGLITRTK